MKDLEQKRLTDILQEKQQKEGLKKVRRFIGVKKNKNHNKIYIHKTKKFNK
jgi:hypothetical protein